MVLYLSIQYYFFSVFQRVSRDFFLGLLLSIPLFMYSSFTVQYFHFYCLFHCFCSTNCFITFSMYINQSGSKWLYYSANSSQHIGTCCGFAEFEFKESLYLFPFFKWIWNWPLYTHVTIVLANTLTMSIWVAWPAWKSHVYLKKTVVYNMPNNY